LVGQRGVRVAVVTGELGGEKIDVVEWSENAAHFVEESLKPAQVISTQLVEDEGRAIVQVAEDQQSLAIGRGGQNVRLAARLTGWKIDIRSIGGQEVAESDGKEVEVTATPTHTSKDEIAKEASEDIATPADEAVDMVDPENQDRDVADKKVADQTE
jgi:N utilization substance protein A